MAEEMLVEEPVAEVEPVEVDRAVDDVEAPDEVVEPEVVPETEEVAGDHRTIPAHLRDYFKSPEGKDAKNAWFERAAFREHFPDGPKQAAEILSIMAEYGGKEGIGEKFKELQTSVEEMTQLDQMIANGDRRAVEKFATQSPEGFSKLAPEVMQEWYKVDPDGYVKSMSGLFANAISSSRIDPTLDRVLDALEYGNTAKAQELLQGIKQWANGFGEAASKPLPAKPDTKGPEVDKRAQELDQRESQVWNGELQSKITAFREPLIQKELQPFTKGAELSPTKKELVNDAILAMASKRMSADTAFIGKWEAYLKAKDMQGAIKASQSKMSEILPDVVKTVAREMLGSPVARVAPKPAAPKPTAPKPFVKPVSKFDEIFNDAIGR